MGERRFGNLLDVSWRSVIRGVGVSIAVTLALAAGAAALLCNGTMELAWINYISVAVLLIAGYTGACLGEAKGNIGNGICAAAVFWIVLICINGIFFELEIKNAFAGMLPILGGAGTYILAGGRKKISGSRRRRKYRHR